MFQKIKKIANLISNMGFRYLFFRIFYTIKTKLGWQKKTFPVQPKVLKYITLENWKNSLPPFFFYGKEISNLQKKEKKTANLDDSQGLSKLGPNRLDTVAKFWLNHNTHIFWKYSLLM